MTATPSEVPIGIAPFELDDEQGVSESTLGRIRDVQALIDQGESEDNIARFIAGAQDFTTAERALARIVLRRHGLARLAA